MTTVITGNIAAKKDQPAVRLFNEGKDDVFGVFTVAHDIRRRNDDGDWETVKTEYFEVTADRRAGIENFAADCEAYRDQHGKNPTVIAAVTVGTRDQVIITNNDEELEKQIPALRAAELGLSTRFGVLSEGSSGGSKRPKRRRGRDEDEKFEDQDEQDNDDEQEDEEAARPRRAGSRSGTRSAGRSTTSRSTSSRSGSSTSRPTRSRPTRRAA
ncbi:hypothetical protein [Nesterenkonia rhizosphaerae]|uniref:Single-stranded DNA-binding protein n=1 Tax=Nesterenkonia rhizosphaerae TaxID=1348272 RepID=A0ABP9G6K7_9MICC